MKRSDKVTRQQTVQRCYVHSDNRYGAVHRLSLDNATTDCGLNIFEGHWWIAGYENDHPANCKACLAGSQPKATDDSFQRSISKRYSEIRSQ